MPTLPLLLADVRACTRRAAHLPPGARPVAQASASARILVAGQAPGRKVRASGAPFDDAAHIAIPPRGFCHPGRGDLPPRPE